MPSGRFRHKILKGSVPVWYSGRLKFPKAHLTPGCEGLEKTPTEAIEEDTLSSVWDFHTWSGRPCRMCALQSVLYTVLRPSAREATVFTTFTSQANPLSPDENVHRYKWRASSDSGHKRLLDVAKRHQLATGTSSCGPFAYGFLPVRGALVLAQNLRTVSRPEVTDLPDRPVMECVWALLDDNPPEITPAGELDPWELARLIVN